MRAAVMRHFQSMQLEVANGHGCCDTGHSNSFYAVCWLPRPKTMQTSDLNKLFSVNKGSSPWQWCYEMHTCSGEACGRISSWSTHAQDTRFVGLGWLWVPGSWAAGTQQARKVGSRLQSSGRSFASSIDIVQTLMGCWCSGKGDPWGCLEQVKGRKGSMLRSTMDQAWKPFRQPQKELYILRDLQDWICLAEQEE